MAVRMRVSIQGRLNFDFDFFGGKILAALERPPPSVLDDAMAFLSPDCHLYRPDMGQ
jgi:hypothetical protein